MMVPGKKQTIGNKMYKFGGGLNRNDLILMTQKRL